MSINKKDEEKILDLYFKQLRSLTEIEKYFKNKYTYREIKDVTREDIKKRGVDNYD